MRSSLTPPNYLSIVYQGFFPRRVKQPGCVANYSPPTTAAAKNEHTTFPSPIRKLGVIFISLSGALRFSRRCKLKLWASKNWQRAVTFRVYKLRHSITSTVIFHSVHIITPIVVTFILILYSRQRLLFH
jgi:hypothetical protein